MLNCRLCSVFSFQYIIESKAYKNITIHIYIDELGLVYSIQCTVYSLQYKVYSVCCTVYSVQCTVYSVQCTVYSVQCTVYSVQCIVYSVQCTVYSVQFTVYSLQCTVYSVQTELHHYITPPKGVTSLLLLSARPVPLWATQSVLYPLSGQGLQCTQV